MDLHRTSTAKLAELVPDPENPRSHSERNIEAIRVSLEKFGQVLPLVVHRETKMIVGGNATTEAMRRLGWHSAKVFWFEGDQKSARALSIALNQTATLAAWDMENLQSHLLALQDEFDFESLGFSEMDMDKILAGVGDPSDVEIDSPVSGKHALEQEHLVLSFVVTPEQEAVINQALKKHTGLKGERLWKLCQATLN